MGFIGRFLWLILSLAAVVLAMIFAASNTHVTTVYPVSYTHLTLPTRLMG